MLPQEPGDEGDEGVCPFAKAGRGGVVGGRPPGVEARRGVWR